MTIAAEEHREYSVREAARVVGVCPMTIRRWIHSGRLKAEKGEEHCDAYHISSEALLEATKDEPGTALRDQLAVAKLAVLKKMVKAGG